MKYSLVVIRMHNIGLDIVEIERIEGAITRWGNSFLNRVYTEAELEIARKRVPALAARFAAKEAVMKALGTGGTGVHWREIEVLNLPGGEPVLYLYGGARERADELGIKEMAVSLTHSRKYALASGVGGV